MKDFLMGNEILVKAAADASAKIMFGYPITPTTEILAAWAKLCGQNPNYKYLQTEDEGAAGFGVLGSVLAGVPAFTATAGPGNILMQDPIVMAEAMRLPFVGFIGQRGGPSTGTVIYSQQEVNLTIFGGNSEGFRVVYSTGSLQDLYDYGKKAFFTAWKYQWPTFVLFDGYQAKMKGLVNLPDQAADYKQLKTKPILTGNLRNVYNLEEELETVDNQYQKEFEEDSFEIQEEETFGENKEIVIFAHGIVASAVKIAIANLSVIKKKFSLFRPITLWPFPAKKALDFIKDSKKIIVFESALGQFSRLVKSQIYQSNIPIKEFLKPAAGFTPTEIERLLMNVL